MTSCNSRINTTDKACLLASKSGTPFFPLTYRWYPIFEDLVLDIQQKMLETWQYIFPQQTRNAFRMTFLPKLEKRPGVVICPKLPKKKTSAFKEGRRPELTRLLSGFNHNQFFLRSNSTAFPIAKQQLISSHKSKRIEKVRSWKETLADFSRFFRPVLSNNEPQGAAKKQKNRHRHTPWVRWEKCCIPSG